MINWDKVIVIDSKSDLEIWNAAIDAAALELERLCRLTKNNQDETTIAYSIDAIRKLKK